MEVKTNVSIHNRFDIVVRNAITGEIEQQGHAENIVLDRIYTRLTTFNTYFVNIVFGSGTGTLSTSRTTLFSRIDSKAATTTQLVRAYPTSVWTRSIRLGANEYNGQTIREVGISDTTININTHAFIADSEGNPLEIVKTDTKIVDIYATVYANVYDVDWGLYWYGDGLRDYLTGGTVGSEQLGISFTTNFDDDMVKISGTRTNNTSEKWVKSSGTFNELSYNKDVQYINWINLGLSCTIPRTGLFADYQRTGVVLGTGDDSKKIFNLPNKNIKDLVVKVDGDIVSGYNSDLWTSVVFDNAPVSGKIVTADYKCNYIPKDEDHILKVTFKIQFGASQPSPIMPVPDYAGIPGANEVIAGSLTLGYFGVVSANDLISGDDLCSAIGLTAGTSQFSDAGWLKYAIGGKVLFVAKKTIRHSVSWDNIDAVGAVFGDKNIILNGIKYAVRLLSTQEWDKLIYPVHKNYGQWAQFEDTDIQVNYSVSGNGCYAWTSTTSGSTHVSRGSHSVSSSSSSDPSYSGSGFRPVLEVLL